MDIPIPTLIHLDHQLRQIEKDLANCGDGRLMSIAVTDDKPKFTKSGDRRSGIIVELTNYKKVNTSVIPRVAKLKIPRSQAGFGHIEYRGFEDGFSYPKRTRLAIIARDKLPNYQPFVQRYDVFHVWGAITEELETYFNSVRTYIDDQLELLNKKYRPNDTKADSSE